MQHLVGSKDILRGNYPIEHQKQIRKFWRDLPPEGREPLVQAAIDEFRVALCKRVDIDQRRKLKIFNLVRRLNEGQDCLGTESHAEELPSEETYETELLKVKAKAYMDSLDDTALIDSLLFPNFEQVGNVTRFILHAVGKEVYKQVNDSNFKKLIEMFAEKDKEVEIKSKTSKTISKAGSKVSKAKKSSQKPVSQTLSQSKSQSQAGASQGEQPQDLKSEGHKQVEELNQFDVHLYSKDQYSGGDSEWHGQSESGRKKNKKKKSAGNVPTSAVSSKTGYGSESNHNQKAMSMRSHDLDGLEIRRTCSSTNNLKEELTFSNHRTYSTKTESFKFHNRETQTQRNYTSSRVEAEVREEDDLSAEETLSRRSNRGSVDHNQTQTSSVEHKKNLRTGSTEREVKRKGTSKSRAFKQLHLPESQGDASKLQRVPGSNKDKKECKLVNLYSENMIKEMMRNIDAKKPTGVTNPLQAVTKAGPVRGPIKPAPISSKAIPGSPNEPSNKPESLGFVPESPPKLASIEKRKSFNLQNRTDEPSSPVAIQQMSEKTPPAKKEKKQIYSTALGKPAKREGEDIGPSVVKRESNKLSPVALDFDSPVMTEKLPGSKIDIKAGFQKHLSVTMSREQGEVFFKNYLNSHISECVSKLRATVNAAEPLRKTAFKRVRHIITQSFKTIRSSLSVYGSWVTGLMTESSDIDLCIKRYELIDRQGIQAILETLETYFRAFKWVVDLKGIYSATVPVLKLTIDPRYDFQELSSAVEDDFRQKFLAKTEEDFQCPGNLSPLLTKHLVHVDITVNDLSISENVGLRTTQYIQQSLPYLPMLADMALLLKTFLANLDLNNAYKGGLGSYAICLLIIAYLEYRKKSRREDAISDVFWGLLHFYGLEFNPSTHGVCASYGQEGETAIPYFEIPSYLKTSPMMILDPTQFMLNNIAVNAFQIGAIQRHFAAASHQIDNVKKKFLEELDKEIKEHGGVKKDYFLSYYKKKDRALDFSTNLIEKILYIIPQMPPAS